MIHSSHLPSMSRLRSVTPRRRQRGVAMLMAIMIAALAVIVASSIYVQQRYSIRLTQNIQDMGQAYQYAYSAEHMVSAWLRRDMSENQWDSNFDLWAGEMLPFEIDDEKGNAVGQIQANVEDMQGYFNINNIYDSEEEKPRDYLLQAYQRLLQAQGIPADLAAKTLDWIDADDKLSSPDSAESPAYQMQDPPYEAANAFMTSPAELTALDWGSIPDKEKEELLQKLQSFAFTLPTPTALNINTASSEALLAVGLKPGQVTTLMDLRRNAPIRTLEELDANVPNIDPKARGTLGVSSNYFRLSGQVRFGKSRLFLNSVLFRDSDGKVHVIMRQFARVPKKTNTDIIF